MENDYEDLENFENNNINSNLKSLEDFFSKDISTFLTPQEIMVMSLSLSHVAQVLALYNTFANVAMFDVKKFVIDHPEYTDTDFDHLDEDTINDIKELLVYNSKEEFNTGNILINSMIDVVINIGIKLCDTFEKDYDKNVPEDSIQFFAMLENCLNSSQKLIQGFFTQQSF